MFAKFIILWKVGNYFIISIFYFSICLHTSLCMIVVHKHFVSHSTDFPPMKMSKELTSSAFILCSLLCCLRSSSLFASSALFINSSCFARNFSSFFFFNLSWSMLCWRILSAAILLRRFCKSRSCASSSWRCSSSLAPWAFIFSTSSCS